MGNMEENTEKNLKEKIMDIMNLEENMVKNIRKVLLGAKNRCSSARSRYPEFLPIRSIEEINWWRRRWSMRL